MNNAIEVHHLSKKYSIRHEGKSKPKTLRELLSFSKRPMNSEIDKLESGDKETKEDFWALKDVSFEVAEGQRIAVIGGNGAGKSTLLKLLSRITEPTSGAIRVKGNVASLLEVGTGFHPELTGRENIFLNGAILGMRHNEIMKKFDSIVSFSGVEKFIDTPVKHYSSGMYVRLAFSVSAWLDPDILIVDEVLSVGDQAFQKQCSERIKELTGDGRTVLLVSHSMHAVRTMCEKALYLQNGKVVSFLPVDEAVAEYSRSLDIDNLSGWGKSRLDPENFDDIAHCDIPNKIICKHAEITNEQGEVTCKLAIENNFYIDITYEVREDLEQIAVPNIHFYDEFGGRFFISLPDQSSPSLKGTYTARCEIPAYLFNNGRYSAMIAMSSFSLDRPHYFAYENALCFEIYESGLIDSRRHGWSGALPGVSRARLDWQFK